jgi:16S rRNA (adenine1518-N6/adenine1519-N6)-dimethyltransferase
VSKKEEFFLLEHPTDFPLPSLKKIIEDYGLITKKSLGQHFLLDNGILEKIVQTADITNRSIVLEVGPGPGGLTRALIQTPAPTIIALEKDERCIHALTSLTQKFPHLQVYSQDALDANLRNYGKSNHEFLIVANLPYNISVALLLKWLELGNFVYQMVLMFQKEVALRLCAKPMTKEYGRLSVITQWHCHITHQFDIKPGSFYPPPKVVSSVVRLTPRFISDYSIRPFLEKITFTAFNQRRKMLRSSLQQLGPLAVEALKMSGLSPSARAEELTVEDFLSLSKHYQTLCLSAKKKQQCQKDNF